jgi:hypothetical protein
VPACLPATFRLAPAHIPPTPQVYIRILQTKLEGWHPQTCPHLEQVGDVLVVDLEVAGSHQVLAASSKPHIKGVHMFGTAALYCRVMP